MRWEGHVARMRGGKCAGFSWGSPKDLKDGGGDGKMGLEWILGRLVGGVWSGLTWLRIGTGGGLL
jgi:hypothetical protein